MSFRFRFKDDIKHINDWFIIPANEKTLEDAKEYIKCLARCKYYSIDDIEILTEKEFKKLNTPKVSKKVLAVYKKVLKKDLFENQLTPNLIARYGLDKNEDLQYYIYSCDVACGFYTREQVLDILKQKQFYGLPDIYDVSDYKHIKKLELDIVIAED
jgi:hypothetical protein